MIVLMFITESLKVIMTLFPFPSKLFIFHWNLRLPPLPIYLVIFVVLITSPTPNSLPVCKPLSIF